MDTETTHTPKPQVQQIGIILADKADSPALRFLLLYINTLQKTFEYEILPAYQEFELIQMLSAQDAVDREKVRALAVPFIEEYEAFLQSENAAYNLKDTTMPDRYVLVTMTRFSDNFYSMRRNRLSVLGLGNWKKTMAPPSIVEFILTLVVRESVAAVTSSFLRGSIHFGTKGCLFDYTPHLADTRYKVLNAFVCANCRKALIVDGLPNLADEIVTVLSKKWLGNVVDLSSPAGISAKLGHNLFVTRGFEATGWEKILNVLQEEGVKQIISILGTVIVAGLLLWLGLK
jgi:hypothetical protein